MKRRDYFAFGIIYLAAFTLAFIWYGWHLILVLILFGWAMNLDNNSRS